MMDGKPEGLRERKRKETLERIARTGLKLFIENGYDETTLEAIAAAAGISRRTFFYYFKSKEDVLLAHDRSNFMEVLRPAILAEPSDTRPIDVARKCLLAFASQYETKESIIVDRLLRSTEALRLRKEAHFVEFEHELAEIFYTKWPAAERRDSLRVAAMLVMGTLRLALDAWREKGGKRSLAGQIARSFDLLESLMSPVP